MMKMNDQQRDANKVHYIVCHDKLVVRAFYCCLPPEEINDEWPYIVGDVAVLMLYYIQSDTTLSEVTASNVHIHVRT